MTEEEMKLQEQINKKRARQRIENMKDAFERERERNSSNSDVPPPTERELLQREDD